jgi:hypothetical protein
MRFANHLLRLDHVHEELMLVEALLEPSTPSCFNPAPTPVFLRRTLDVTIFGAVPNLGAGETN